MLVLYLAGELANGEKTALEKRLAAEPKLAAELDRLRAAQAFCNGAISHGDQTARLPVSEGVAVRRVSRAMQQWQVDRVRAMPPVKKKGLPLPWWCYPAAAAAAIIVGFLIWSSRQPIGPVGGPNDGGPVAINTPTTEESQPSDGQPDDTVAQADYDFLSSSFALTPPETATADASADETVSSPATSDDGTSLFPTRNEETFQ
jgi:hypothetical protein